MKDMDLEALEVKIEDGIAEVKLLGPGKGNAMGPELFRELPIVFKDLDRDSEVRAIILYGSGEHFTYGLDLKKMMADLGKYIMGPQMAGKRLDLLDLIRELQTAADEIESCRKPVIAAMHGWCIGGGLDLAAACDIRLCAADTKFSLREVKIAIVADLGSLQRLPPIIGQGATRELAFTGKDIDAEKAAKINLVNDVLPDRAALMEEARKMAREIAQNPPLTVQGIKQVMNYTSTKETSDGLKFVAAWNSAFLQSMDLNEAFAAFVERRPPVYKGK